MALLRIGLFLNVVFSILLFSIGLVDQFEFPKFIFRLLVVCSAGSWLIFSGALRLKVLRAGLKAVTSRDTIGLGFLLLLASATVSTAFSLSPRTSFYGLAGCYSGWLSIASYTGLYFLTKALFQTQLQARRLMGAAVFATVLAALYAWAQYLGYDPITWRDVLGGGFLLRPPSTAGHPNFASAEMVMILPFIIASLADVVHEKKHPRAIVSFGLCVLLVSAIVIMRSRGSWLALGVVAAVFAATGAHWNRRILAICIAALVSLSGIVIAIRWKIDPLIVAAHAPVVRDYLDRFKDILAPGAARLEYIKSGLKMFRAHPLLGVGPDAFQFAFAQQRTSEYWLSEWEGVAPRAHNELVNIAATQGILGLLGVVTLVTGLVIAAARALRSAPEKGFAGSYAYRASLAAGVVGFFVQNLSSFTTSVTGTLFVTMAALLTNEAQVVGFRESAASPPWFSAAVVSSTIAALWIFFHSFWPVKGSGTVVFAVLVCSIALAAVYLAAEGEPMAHRRRAVVRAVAAALVSSALIGKLVLCPLEGSVIAQYAFELGRIAPQWSLLQIERAEEIDRTELNYVEEIGALASAVSKASKDPKVAGAFQDQEIRAYEYAAKLVPQHDHYQFLLGIALARRISTGREVPGDRQRFIAQADLALEREPSNPIYLAAIIATDFAIGEGGRAFVVAREAVARYPDYSVFHYQLGHAALALHDYELASKELTRALSGRLFESIQLWRGSLEIDPVLRFTAADREQATKDLSFAKTALQKR